VNDDTNNAGQPFVPTTANFNDSFDLFDGLGSPGFESADAVVVTSPAEAFTSEELTALGEFVGNGGALFLFDQANDQENNTGRCSTSRRPTTTRPGRCSRSARTTSGSISSATRSIWPVWSR
jgi:hypothetical protein